MKFPFVSFETFVDGAPSTSRSVGKEVKPVPFSQDIEQERATRDLAHWMDAYGQDVIHLAYMYLQNHHAAEDVAQDVFLRAYTKWDSFRGQSSVKTWLLSITANRCKDELRSWAAKHEVKDETHIATGVAQANTENDVVDKLENNDLWQAVASLPVKYRDVIVLFYQQELSGAEIAEVLNSTEQSVRTRLYRGRTLLKTIMKKSDLMREARRDEGFLERG